MTHQTVDPSLPVILFLSIDRNGLNVKMQRLGQNWIPGVNLLSPEGNSQTGTHSTTSFISYVVLAVAVKLLFGISLLTGH